MSPNIAKMSFIPHPEVAHLQIQLQEAHQTIESMKPQAYFGTVASPPVGSPQPIPGHQYPFNAGNPTWGLAPPHPIQSSNLCHSFPFCKFERCNFEHKVGGQVDVEQEAIQAKSYVEARALYPPLARNEPFRPRASPELTQEFDRLMTLRASGKRQRL